MLNGAPSPVAALPNGVAHGGPGPQAPAVLHALLQAVQARDALLGDMLRLWMQAHPYARLRDHGLPESNYFSQQETDFLRALLPPNRVIPHAELERAFAHLYWDHMTHAQRVAVDHHVRTVGARLRAKLRTLGWTLPPKAAAGWLLLEPGREPPPDWGAWARGTGRRVPLAHARAVVEALDRGATRTEIEARTGVGKSTSTLLRQGRHWAQREGLVALPEGLGAPNRQGEPLCAPRTPSIREAQSAPQTPPLGLPRLAVDA